MIGWLLARDADGDAFANARRAGVMYLIWNNRIWGSYLGVRGLASVRRLRRAPVPSPYDTTCHRDHVHVSFSWEGAMARTSMWTGTLAAVDYGPCRDADLNWAAPYTGPRTTPCPSYPRVTRPPAPPRSGGR